MLYSCLVDADFLDTERFMDGERGRGGYDDLPTLLRRLKEYIAPWQEPKTALNKLRCKILNSCLDAGSKPKGIYTLTVPTGGGKTVASLAFALRHAVAHGMKRVIYVVPYTSIIEQNAEVFREILGNGNVLEHHSGVQFELSDGASPEEVRRALAAENWDMPVIVTTAVQFFESIYANRSSKCRKLHNLADSVIILDEAQNTSCEQMKMFLTRMGFNSKMVITGDVTQIDLPADKMSGLKQAVRVLKNVEGIGICELTDQDVVRHVMVQRIIKAYADYEAARNEKRKK